MEEQLLRHNLEGKRFEAIDGSSLPEWAGVPVHDLTDGELGCTLSHLRCIWELSQTSAQTALICEDDASFCFYDRWPISLKRLAEKADFDMLKLWHFGEFSKPLVLEEPTCEWGTTAYLISRKGMLSIAETFFDEGKLRQVKLTAADALLSSNVKVCSLPLIIPFNDFEEMNSTIHTDHTALHLSFVQKAYDAWDSVDSAENGEIKEDGENEVEHDVER